MNLVSFAGLERGESSDADMNRPVVRVSLDGGCTWIDGKELFRRVHLLRPFPRGARRLPFMALLRTVRI